MCSQLTIWQSEWTEYTIFISVYSMKTACQLISHNPNVTSMTLKVVESHCQKMKSNTVYPYIYCLFNVYILYIYRAWWSLSSTFKMVLIRVQKTISVWKIMSMGEKKYLILNPIWNWNLTIFISNYLWFKVFKLYTVYGQSDQL